MDDRLQEISRQLYGEHAELMVVPVSELNYLGKNARYMNSETFKQLKNNIEKDQFLSSVPLCIEEKGKLVIYSGNHRVMAAKEAGVKELMVLVDKRELTRSQKIAIQLSHNALVGVDDTEILSNLWAEIEEISAKMYAGLDSKLIEELEKAQYESFNPAQFQTKQMTFWFLPEDMDNTNKLLEQFGDGNISIGGENHVVPMAYFDRALKLLIAIKKSAKIKNSALAFAQMIELAEEKYSEITKKIKLPDVKLPKGTPEDRINGRMDRTLKERESE